MAKWYLALFTLTVLFGYYQTTSGDRVEREVHALIAPLGWLVGTWRSTEATGMFPTIKTFDFQDVLKFEEIGQPLMHVTFSSDIGDLPRHRERGFLRFKVGEPYLGYLASHNLGISEVSEGAYNETNIHLESVAINGISFRRFPMVQKIIRDFTRIADDEIEYKVFMETEDTPLTQHLAIKYKKSAE